MATINVRIDKVTTTEEWDGVIDTIWATMDGSDPSHQVIFPTFGTGPEAKASAIAKSKQRMWKEHKEDPHSTWIYVQVVRNMRDDAAASDLRSRPTTKAVQVAGMDFKEAGGPIVGCCQWRFYEEDPFPGLGAPKIIAHWWPEGVGRDFADEVIRQCFRPRRVCMRRPHSGLSMMCVHPEWQRRGLGTMLMQWGVEQTDQLDLESFIEATPHGEELYKHFKYHSIGRMSVNMKARDHGNKRPGWDQLERQKLPIDYTAVWRPKQGNWTSDVLSMNYPELVELMDQCVWSGNDLSSTGLSDSYAAPSND